MNYQYRVLSRGVSSFSGNLEGFADALQELLNDVETRELTRAGWEIWRVEKFDGYQSNKGFLLVLRRAE